ncbi:MAG: hypothetical protein WCO88_13555 [Actinomycetota bacterium]
MRSTRRLLRWCAVAALAVAAVAVPAATERPRAAVAADGLGAGGEFHPLTPARVYDSRADSAVNEPAPGPKPATPTKPTFDISLLGLGGLPADANQVLAVVVNITVVSPTASGWLNAFGAGSPPSSDTSLVNFVKDQVVPNLAIVRPGAGGKLSIQLFTPSATATAQVVVDVFGWFSTSAAADRGARLVPVTPGRVLDTRTGTGGRTGAVGQGESIELQIRGASVPNAFTIPSTPDVVGVVLNVTGVNTTAGSKPTFVSVVPDPVVGQPSTSNLNLTKGLIKPNLVIVPVNATDGKVRLFNNTGTVDLVADVVGYLQLRPDNTRAGRVVPLGSPFRVFDTRDPAFGSVELGPGQAEPWSFADFANSVNIGGTSVGPQLAVIGNLTSASLRRQYATQAANSFISVYPDQLAAGAAPSTSNLNTVENVPVPNLTIVKYGASTTSWVYNLAGYAHYLFDASAVVLND